jgi:hypothetical protein
MGDMGDLFKDLKDIKIQRAQSRVNEFKQKKEFIENSITQSANERRGEVYFRVDDSGTFNVHLISNRITGTRNNRTTIQFYPTKGSWQFKGKMFHGGVDAFVAWATKTIRKTL